MQYQFLEKYNFRIEKYIYRHYLGIFWLIKSRFFRSTLRSSTSDDVLRDRLARLLTEADIAFLVESIGSEEVLKLAEKALNHEFDVLGSGSRIIDMNVWNKDIISGKEWPNGTYFKRYNIIDINDCSDVKVPWEISRCHPLLHLGLAYQITKDERYSEEVMSTIEAWIKNNPFMYSINWTCSMEVGIRAVNWIYALRLIKDSESLSEFFLKKLSDSLYQHALFIYNNLEDTEPYSGNHYMADLVGLIYICSLLEDKQAKGWYDFALSEFWSEIRKQFLPSGFHYEKSISYHRLMTELVAYTFAFLKRTGEFIPLDIEPRVGKLFEVIVEFTNENGKAPAIADEDNGRFLPFATHDFRDYKYLTFLYNYLFKTNLKIDKHFLKAYQDIGFAVFKDSLFYLFVSNTGISKYPENGKWNGTHTHCDLLSFVLSVKGLDFIIDPGTFVYTRDVNRRDEYRSTAKHNTVQIDNIEQFTFRRYKPFSMYGDAIPAMISCNGNQIESSYIKNIDGKYYNHKRVFSADDKFIMINDDISFAGEHTAKIYFHLAQRVKVTQKDNVFELTHGNQMISLSFPDSLIGIVIDDTISTSYGVEGPSKTIVLTGDFSNSIVITTKIHIK